MAKPKPKTAFTCDELAAILRKEGYRKLRTRPKDLIAGRIDATDGVVLLHPLNTYRILKGTPNA